MADYQTVLAELIRLVGAAGTQGRATALAEGFLALGWRHASVAVAVAPRRCLNVQAGEGDFGLLDVPTPDGLAPVLDADIPGATVLLPLQSGATLAGVAALTGEVDANDPLTAAYAAAAGAVLAREFEIERSASAYRHDLRAPLTVILGWCELLLESAQAGDRDALETIVRQTQRINSLLDQQAASGGTGPRAERL